MVYNSAFLHLWLIHETLIHLSWRQNLAYCHDCRWGSQSVITNSLLVFHQIMTCIVKCSGQVGSTEFSLYCYSFVSSHVRFRLQHLPLLIYPHYVLFCSSLSSFYALQASSLPPTVHPSSPCSSFPPVTIAVRWVRLCQLTDSAWHSLKALGAARTWHQHWFMSALAEALGWGAIYQPTEANSLNRDSQMTFPKKISPE